MIVEPNTSGDQCAGVSCGELAGSQGKAQAPSPSQALLLFLRAMRRVASAPLRIVIIANIIRITSQEFLREIRVVMMLEALAIIG
jgi:hypothetical protein